MHLVDAHCHLEMDAFDADRESVIARARAAGVDTLLTIGTDLASSRQAVALARAHPGIYAAIGVHPHEVARMDEATAPGLRALAADPKVVAFGEIGLDYYKEYSPRATQLARLREQLGLAAELRLPLMLHVRDAHDEIQAILRETGVPCGGVVHCYSGSSAQAKTYLDLGLLLSVPGVVTFKNARTLVEVVQQVGVEHLLVETDAPFLAPEPHRGKRNEPAYVRLVAERVAGLKGLAPEAVAEATTRNFFALFHPDGR
ncbi:MAG: TatD family hydrolase [Deltaproteobacteria bacterium]|nr:TatD family hydrolase [Deltaproteobacteria bacterium]MBI3078553.1 TatD family hydrolase [Deltaproteobacteria bacterium]